MEEVRRFFDSPWARPTHGWACIALVVLTVGCSSDPVSVHEAATLQQSNAAVDVLDALGLEMLPAPMPTYYSPGHRERAESLQAWLRDADAFFQRSLRIAPPFRLAVSRGRTAAPAGGPSVPLQLITEWKWREVSTRLSTEACRGLEPKCHSRETSSRGRWTCSC